MFMSSNIMEIIVVFLQIILEIIILLPSEGILYSIDFPRFVFGECPNHCFIVKTEVL